MELKQLMHELKQVELKKLANVTLDDDLLLGLVNDAVLAVYSRIPIHRIQATVSTLPGVTSYKFDTYDPNVQMNISGFQVISIGTVTAVNPRGKEECFTPTMTTRPINFSTPSPDTLLVAEGYLNHDIFVELSVTPEPVTKDCQYLEVPARLIPLIRLYVGYKAYSTLTTGMDKEDNMYFVRFASAVNQELLSNHQPEEEMEYSMLNERGFL